MTADNNDKTTGAVERRINGIFGALFGDNNKKIQFRCVIDLPFSDMDIKEPDQKERLVISILQEDVEGDIDSSRKPDANMLFQRKIKTMKAALEAEDVMNYAKANWSFYSSKAADSIVSVTVLRCLGCVVYDELHGYFDSVMAYNSESQIETCFKNLYDLEWLKRKLTDKLLETLDLPPRSLLNQISTLKYEKRELNTSLFVLNDVAKSNALTIELLEDSTPKYDLGKYPSIARKLLELAGKNGSLVVKKEGEDYRILGVSGNESIAMNAHIRFTGHIQWLLIDRNETICKYVNGDYEFTGIMNGDNAVETALDDIKEELENIIQGLPECNLDGGALDLNVIKEALEEVYGSAEHGTAIVFLDKETRMKELERLIAVSRAYRIKPVSLTCGGIDLEGITSIDGAIIAGFDLECYAIGAILDGEAVICGDAGRGARYNSVINYACWVYQKYKDQNAAIMAVVRSEDGMVTIKTNSGIEKLLDEMAKAASKEENTLS